MQKIFLPRALFVVLRLSLIMVLAVTVARYLNGRNYNDFFSRTLVKIHAGRGVGVDANEIARLLVQRDKATLQKVLDRNYNIFALVVTDCRSVADTCEGQRVVAMTNASLWQKQISPAELSAYPYSILVTPASVMDLLQTKEKRPPAREVLGRVYSISTIPTFDEDYSRWLRDPFRDNEIWHIYLMTMTSCLLGGIAFWLVLELFLEIRRIEQKNAEQREAAIIRDADSSLRRLEEKKEQLERQELRTRGQLESYIGKIRDLERRLQHGAEYREVAETMISEMEAENREQSLAYQAELARTVRQKQALEEEMSRYRKAAKRDRSEASRALESVIAPQVADPFEQELVARLQDTAKFRDGEWRLLTQFEVAPGRAASQVTDCIVISKDCVVVIEAKNYHGTITAEGDAENTRWLCRSGGTGGSTVRSAWGINPYQQVRHYVMGVMKLVQRSDWKEPVFGVAVFPEGTDIAGVGERIGKYYRITTADRLVNLVHGIEAESRRENVHSKRPTPTQMEAVLTGVTTS